MRGFLTLLLIGAVCYGAYWYWNLEEPPPDPATDETEETVSADLSKQESSPATAEAQELPGPPPPPSEEETLRGAAGGTGPEADEARFRLARLLLAKKTSEADVEAKRFLRQVFEEGGTHAPHAAALMLRRSEVGSEQIELASFLHEALGRSGDD